jgi:hypothetical protein
MLTLQTSVVKLCQKLGQMEKSQTCPPVQEAKMARDCHDLSKPQGGLLQATEHRASSRSVRWSWSSTKTVLLGIRDVELTGHLPLRFVTIGPSFCARFRHYQRRSVRAGAPVDF